MTLRKMVPVVGLAGVVIAVVVSMRGGSGSVRTPPPGHAPTPTAGSPTAVMAPARSAPAAVTEDVTRSAASAPAAASDPVSLEAAAYPWDEFAEVLGRELSTQEREGMRDLRKEHGLRLAEAHANMKRGQMGRAEFDRWKQERAELFRSEVQTLLGCSAEEVSELLAVKMRPRTE